MTGMKLRDGDITLYHRRDSKNWQADIRLPDGGRHTVSLRTANEKTAKDKVILIYESHSTRRTFITTLAHKGVNVRVLAALAGHKSIATTQRYIELNENVLRAAVEMV